MEVYLKDNLMNEAPNTCVYWSYLEGKCDSLDIVFDDSEGAIKALELKKGDVAQVTDEFIDTGNMYISGIDYNGTQAAIRALSLPLSAFKTKTQQWNNATMTAVIQDALKGLSLKVVFIDKPNFIYMDVAMIESEPLKFLSGKLALEGYGVRVNNDTVYIFDEAALEKGDYKEQYTEESFQDAPKYSTKDAKLVSEIENTYTAADGTLICTSEKSGIEGKIIRLNMPVASVGESIRFSKGMMRAANKFEYVAEAGIEGLTRIPGDIVYLADAPIGHNGENLIYMIKNDIANNKQTLYMRRPIEGDY